MFAIGEPFVKGFTLTVSYDLGFPLSQRVIQWWHVTTLGYSYFANTSALLKWSICSKFPSLTEWLTLSCLTLIFLCSLLLKVDDKDKYDCGLIRKKLCSERNKNKLVTSLKLWLMGYSILDCSGNHRVVLILLSWQCLRGFIMILLGWHFNRNTLDCIFCCLLRCCCEAQILSF